MTTFGGGTFDEKRDGDRLRKQLAAVKHYTLGTGWHYLSDISDETGAPEASVSARLRDLRKEKFGGYSVERRYVANGRWQYRVSQEVAVL